MLEPPQLPPKPPEPEGPASNVPSFANVVTTGNIAAVIATVITALPLITLVYEAGSLVTNIQTQLTASAISIENINQAELRDRADLGTIRDRLVVTESRLEGELAIVREKIAVIDAAAGQHIK